MGKPLVSVVMANYNTDEKHLRQCIESILLQSFGDFEFIVVDDCSTNGNTAVIASYRDARIKLIRNAKNSGISHSVNRGIRAAAGKYIARMDSDDIAHPNRLALQAQYLDQHADVDVLVGRGQKFGARKGVFACFAKTPEQVAVSLFFACGINNPTAMMRRAFLQQYGIFYDEDILNGEDYLFWSTCARHGRIAEYPGILLFYRCHARQISVYDRLRQIESANAVRARWLLGIGVTPTDQELWMHYSLCKAAYNPKDIPLEHHFEVETLSAWCGRLCSAHRENPLFSDKMFSREVRMRFCVAIAKAVLSRQARWSEVRRLSFLKEHVRFSAFFLLLRYAVYSLRANQTLVLPKKPPVR